MLCNHFESELNGMWTGPNDWPKDRSYKIFKAWFEWHIGSLVLDLTNGRVLKGYRRALARAKCGGAMALSGEAMPMRDASAGRHIWLLIFFARPDERNVD